MIRITLQNVSNLPVDHLNVTFNDSLRDNMEAKLSEGNLSLSSVYEMEFDITKRPVFVWNEVFDKIEPAEERTILIECSGKSGW